MRVYASRAGVTATSRRHRSHTGEEPAEPAEPATVAPISAAQVCRWAEGTLALACGATVYLYNTDYSSKGSATLNAAVTAMDFKADGSV